MPELPRYRRPPARIDDASSSILYTPRVLSTIYYQACDLLLRELVDTFDQSEFLPEVLCLDSLLLNAANGNNYESELESAKRLFRFRPKSSYIV